MKYSLLLVALLTASSLMAETTTEAKKINALETNVSSVETSVSNIDTKVTTVEDKIALMESEMAAMKAAEEKKAEEVLSEKSDVLISVTGQGVAPMNTTSPAQAYALAKRAATADAYRLIAEKVKGVRIDGQDLIKNMMVKRSTVRTSVQAMVRNANVVETTFKEGLCEVEMEIVLSHAQFAQ
jgi:hypothetical protein